MNELDLVLCSDEDVLHWLIYDRPSTDGWCVENVRLALSRPEVLHNIVYGHYAFRKKEAEILTTVLNESGYDIVWSEEGSRTYIRMEKVIDRRR
jgi:hypothetical protein